MEAKEYKMRVRVGPTCVKEIASSLREAGMREMTLEGTEHIYFSCYADTDEGAKHHCYDALRLIVGKTYGLHPNDFEILQPPGEEFTYFTLRPLR